MSRFIPTAASVALIALASACSGDEVTYQPRPAATVQAGLPPVPSIAQKPIKDGDAYTVWGASYHLRSRVHKKSVENKELTITGYIVKTNLPDAPKCAVHKTGKEDPEGCEAPIPTFWIADSKDATEKDAIKVMGWASNYAQLYDAVNEYKKRARHKKDDEEPLMDGIWGVKIPDPLPVKGVKVKVKGDYAMTFNKSTKGSEVDPIMGILTYSEVTYEDQPTEVATLPGMR